MLINPLANDLDAIMVQTQSLWETLRNQTIFITGGTGFIGCWLLESFIWANTTLNLNANAVVLTRNKIKFAEKSPHLYLNPALSFHEGDIENFKHPTGKFSHIIHAATDSNIEFYAYQPLDLFKSITQGTKHTLEFAKACGAKHFLLISSGAVYGKQPHQIAGLPEDYPCQQPSITDSKSAYAAGKSIAEDMSCQYGTRHGFDIKIARCFAFVGPYLPLNIHYAIGNFIRDALNGGPIIIKSDGTPYRSYLYSADLAIWLWTILLRGQHTRPYNVGSNDAFTIAETAQMVANKIGSGIKIIKKDLAISLLPERYIPDTTRAYTELNLRTWTNLANALDKTINYIDRKLTNHDKP